MTAALGVTNRVDAAVITALAANVLNPVSNLQNEHVAVKYRYDGTSVSVDFDLGAAYSLDTFVLMGVSGAAPSFRIYLSSAPSPIGDLWDSGALSGLSYFDPRYKKFVCLKTVPVTARYVRITQSEAAVIYTEWGVPFIGLRSPFGIDNQTPHVRIPVRKSEHTRGTGGATFVDRKKGTWRQNVTFNFISEAERTGFIEDLAVAMVNTGHKDFLWVPNVSSAALPQDCIWGFQVSDEMPIAQTLYTDPTAKIYSLELQIEDRG